MFKKTAALILILCLTLLSACAKASINEEPEEKEPSEKIADESAEETSTETYETTSKEPADAVSTVYPLTVTDQAGRTVTFDKKPETIVSGYYISTSAIIALGLKDELVGIEAKAAKRAIYQLSAPELIDLPNVGSVKEFDLEGCAALAPDVAILPLKLKDAAETLTDLGIHVLLVNPESLDLMQEMITLIGEVTDTRAKADELLAFTRQTLDRLAELESPFPMVYMASNSDFLSTAGAGMYQSDMIALAGGLNVAAEIEDTYWATVSYEQILAWNPDIILLAAEASYTVEDVLNDPALADVTAVKEGRVYAMPVNAESWDSPVPGAILGSVYVASLMNAGMTEEEFLQIADDFYETFYGFAYSEN